MLLGILVSALFLFQSLYELSVFADYKKFCVFNAACFFCQCYEIFYSLFGKITAYHAEFYSVRANAIWNIE